MKVKRLIFIIIMAAALFGSIPFASKALAAGNQPAPSTTLVDDVRRATARYRDIKVAKNNGYALFHGCVNGPDGGAMGVHFVKGDLVGDGKVDATKPEALIYEWKDGRYTLLGVEYVVLAADWDKANSMPPVLKGQLFTYTGSPNRYGIPAFYALHVWAWKNNPNGMFADWNSHVSCEQFTGDAAAQ
jgi:hypothetical protein